VTIQFAPQPGFRQNTWAVLPEALSAADCDRLVGEGAALRRLTGQLLGGATAATVRRSEVAWLADAPEHAWIYRRMAEIAGRLNAENFRHALDGFDEELQLAMYASDVAGHYDWHVDRGGRGAAARRKLTIVVQLSDPAAYAGGDLELNVTGSVVAAPRGRGTAIAFPSYALHRVAPVTRGHRFSLVGWLHGPDFV